MHIALGSRRPRRSIKAPQIQHERAITVLIRKQKTQAALGVMGNSADAARRVLHAATTCKAAALSMSTSAGATLSLLAFPRTHRRGRLCQPCRAEGSRGPSPLHRFARNQATAALRRRRQIGLRRSPASPHMNLLCSPAASLPSSPPLLPSLIHNANTLQQPHACGPAVFLINGRVFHAQAGH